LHGILERAVDLRVAAPFYRRHATRVALASIFLEKIANGRIAIFA